MKGSDQMSSPSPGNCEELAMNEDLQKEERIVEVYRARDPMQAHLFAAELKNDGVECQVVGDHLGGALGEVPLGWSTAPQILVKESCVERARELLSEYEQLLATSYDRDEEEEGDEEEFDEEEREEGTEA